MERNQREMAYNLFDENKIVSEMLEEILERAEKTRYHLDFMQDYSEYDQMEVEFPITIYKKDGETI
ncbi:hypothetical protein FZW96_01540 [Bacillus sp. BGMRC 2118]|nr:hypothetical protein FZW96_01540 [Bacillus sp. BGMRC 2118]